MPLPALVLVHGGAHAADCWDLTVEQLRRQAPDLPVLAVDLPGRAGKPADLASVSIGDCVESVVADIEGAGLSDVVICGHSMAGVTISAGMPDVPPQPGRFQSQCRASQHDWRSATA